MVVFGLCTLIGAVLTMFLPETAHKPLPDTIEDVERTDDRWDNFHHKIQKLVHACSLILLADLPIEGHTVIFIRFEGFMLTYGG